MTCYGLQRLNVLNSWACASYSSRVFSSFSENVAPLVLDAPIGSLPSPSSDLSSPDWPVGFLESLTGSGARPIIMSWLPPPCSYQEVCLWWLRSCLYWTSGSEVWLGLGRIFRKKTVIIAESVIFPVFLPEQLWGIVKNVCFYSCLWIHVFYLHRFSCNKGNVWEIYLRCLLVCREQHIPDISLERTLNVL